MENEEKSAEDERKEMEASIAANLAVIECAGIIVNLFRDVWKEMTESKNLHPLAFTRDVKEDKKIITMDKGLGPKNKKVQLVGIIVPMSVVTPTVEAVETMEEILGRPLAEHVPIPRPDKPAPITPKDPNRSKH